MSPRGRTAFARGARAHTCNLGGPWRPTVGLRTPAWLGLAATPRRTLAWRLAARSGSEGGAKAKRFQPRQQREPKAAGRVGDWGGKVSTRLFAPQKEFLWQGGVPRQQEG